ncbi:fork head domain-containing protein, partial [Blastocladiella britannica]
KPPYSYASLIAEAISAQPMGCASLQDIYEYIADRYAFYKNATHAWQNSVRHNLALNKCFLKIGKVGGQGNKGFVWRLDPERANEISDESRRGRKVNDSSSKNDH